MKKRIKIGLASLATVVLTSSSCISLVSCTNQANTKPDEINQPEITEFKYETVDFLTSNYSVCASKEKVESKYFKTPLEGRPIFTIDDEKNPFYGAKFIILSRKTEGDFKYFNSVSLIGWNDEDYPILEEYGWDIEKVKECKTNWLAGKTKIPPYIFPPKYISVINKASEIERRNVFFSVAGIMIPGGIRLYDDYSENPQKNETIYNNFPNRDIDFTNIDGAQFVGFFNKSHKPSVKYDRDITITFASFIGQISFLETYNEEVIDIKITLDFSNKIDTDKGIMKNPDRIALFSKKLEFKMPKEQDIYFDSKIEGNTTELWIDRFDNFKVVGPEVFKNIETMNGGKKVTLPADCYYYDNSFPADFVIIGGKKLKAPVKTNHKNNWVPDNDSTIY